MLMFGEHNSLKDSNKSQQLPSEGKYRWLAVELGGYNCILIARQESDYHKDLFALLVEGGQHMGIVKKRPIASMNGVDCPWKPTGQDDFIVQGGGYLKVYDGRCEILGRSSTFRLSDRFQKALNSSVVYRLKYWIGKDIFFINDADFTNTYTQCCNDLGVKGAGCTSGLIDSANEELQKGHGVVLKMFSGRQDHDGFYYSDAILSLEPSEGPITADLLKEKISGQYNDGSFPKNAGGMFKIYDALADLIKQGKVKEVAKVDGLTGGLTGLAVSFDDETEDKLIESLKEKAKKKKPKDSEPASMFDAILAPDDIAKSMKE